MILTNCRVVTTCEVFTGTVVTSGGRISDVQPGRSMLPEACDLEGRLLIPGLVEIHTDNLEKHIRPRSARWPGPMAMAAHDAQIRGAGITTVLDAVCIGVERDLHGQPRDYLADSMAALDHARSEGALGADHYLHTRCELPHPALLESFEPAAGRGDLRMVSLMDHTPGQRQTADLEIMRRDYQQSGPVTDEWFEAMLASERERQAAYAEPNRRALVARVKELAGVVLASHDDSCAAHVEQAAAEGARISEFPTTLEAARAARSAGLANVMGSPNVVLGGSQSGNLSAVEAVHHGLVDALSSDYVPVSLLNAALMLAAQLPLPQAIALVTSTPAALASFDDRGRIEPGLRADLVEVSQRNGLACIHRVWREGVRVA